jgi:hypothetical protein
MNQDESKVELFTEFAVHAQNAQGPFATFLGNNTPVSERANHIKASVEAASKALGRVIQASPMNPEILSVQLQAPFWDTCNATIQVENVSSLTGNVTGLGSRDVTFHDSEPGFSIHVPSNLTTGTAHDVQILEGQQNSVIVNLSENGLLTTQTLDFTGPPLGVTITPSGITNNAATLTVSTDDTRYPEAATSLDLQYKQVSDPGYTVVPESGTITGLLEKTEYEARARLVRNGNQSRYTHQTFTTTELPGKVRNLSVTNTGLSTASISWDSPVVSVPPVTGYRVTLVYLAAGNPDEDTRDGQVFETTETNFTLSGLNYDSTVSFEVVAVNSNGSGLIEYVEVPMQATTVPPKPDPPVFASHTETSITVSYTHVVHDPEVTAYTVEAVGPGQSVTFTHTHVSPAIIEIPGLTSGADKLHSIRLSALNKTGASDQSDPAQIYTADVTDPVIGASSFTEHHDRVEVSVTGATDNSGQVVGVFAFLAIGAGVASSKEEAKATVESPGYSGGSDTGPDANMTLTTSFDGTSFAPAEPNLEFTLHILAIDRVGNVTLQQFPGVQVADKIPPTLTVDSVVPGSGVTVSGSFSDAHSSPVTLKVVSLLGTGTLESAPGTVVTTTQGSPFNVSLTQAWDGVSVKAIGSGFLGNVYLQAEDTSQNVTVSSTDFQIPDTQPPVITIQSATANSTHVHYDVSAVDDSGDPVTLRVFVSETSLTDPETETVTNFSSDTSGVLTQLGGSSLPALPPVVFETNMSMN